MKSGCFELRKWVSNQPNLFDTEQIKNSSNVENFIIPTEQNCKTLGIGWNANSDTFQYTNSKWHKQAKISKRQILSITSQIFDPIGLLGPITVKAKAILQKLWRLKIDWDESIPASLFTEWQDFYNQLPAINKITIPRQITQPSFIVTQIHAFSDASELAYGTCIYLRSKSASSKILVRIITAKSRIAPLKTLTIPRLELSGALLMAKLTNKVISALKMQVDGVYYWCDSSIVLSWLKTEPAKLKTFVAHRVSEIQELSSITQWHHVKSSDNPSDLLSRGLSAEELASNSLWWHGPSWLSTSQDSWPASKFHEQLDLPELKTVTHLCTNQVSVSFDLFNKYSSLLKLQRITAYCLRFIENLKLPIENRYKGNLTTHEIDKATNLLIKLAQNSEFSESINLMKRNQSIPKQSKIKSLDPFLDVDNILRVGGRLQKSNLEFNQKHPIVLPSNHKFTHLIIQYEHAKNFHSGVQLTLSSVRQQYWPLRGKQTVRKILRRCIVCFKSKPSNMHKKMSVLPSARVIPAPPFNTCGVDYAGPYLIKDGKLRNRKFIKSYICLFVCFASKAIHLELVSDLTKEGFLNAFKRFIAHRGYCSEIYSDNATNFVAANKELQKINEFFRDTHLQNFLLENKIKWNFIPARSPHMGGLWESSIKSMKYHLGRVCKDMTFTSEEFYTLITQIESILNSRPLYPLSHDPEDFNPLTPGHFLVGGPLNSLPIPSAQVQGTHLSRYHHLQKMVCDFWKKWSHEYLHTLQERSKWQFKVENSAFKGALVILREDNTPPQTWQLGRIIDIHPGSDGLVRVVSVKTKNSVIKRSIVKVCLLPIENHVPL